MMYRPFMTYLFIYAQASFLANQSHIGAPLIGAGGLQHADVRGDANTLDNPGGVSAQEPCVLQPSLSAKEPCIF